MKNRLKYALSIALIGSVVSIANTQKKAQINNSGKPYIIHLAAVKSDQVFSYQLPMRENDVYLVELAKN